MIRLSQRYAQLGLAGALFWFGQLVLWELLWPGWLKALSHSGPAIKLADDLRSAENAVLLTLAVTLIFFTGLFLDILCLGFPAMELACFRAELLPNCHWLKEHPAFEDPELQKRLLDFTDTSDPWWNGVMWRDFLSLLVHKAVSRGGVRITRRSQVQSGQWLQGWLHAIVLHEGSQASVLSINDQMDIETAGRMVAMALLILTMEGVYFLVTPSYRSPSGVALTVAPLAGLTCVATANGVEAFRRRWRSTLSTVQLLTTEPRPNPVYGGALEPERATVELAEGSGTD